MSLHYGPPGTTLKFYGLLLNLLDRVLIMANTTRSYEVSWSCMQLGTHTLTRQGNAPAHPTTLAKQPHPIPCCRPWPEV